MGDQGFRNLLVAASLLSRIGNYWIGPNMINEALRLIRIFHDMKQVELAEKLGVSSSHISEVEKGKKTPSLDLIKRYSVVFNLPVSSIIFFAEELPKTKAGSRVRAKIAGKVLNILRFIERKADVEG